jgi:hypothetical protein
MTAIPEDISSTIAAGNLKAIAEQPAMLSNLAYASTVFATNLSQQNAVANQQAMNELGVAVVGGAVDIVGNSGARKAHPATDDDGHSAT